MQRISGKSQTSELLKAFGNVVRIKRVALNYSQEAFADVVGIDRSHMGKIERGERNVTVLNIERIAGALDTLPSSLLSEAGF